MNLTTRYLGLELSNPFIVGASPLCDNLDTARSLQDSGAAALVMRSLFEEQVTASGSLATNSRPSSSDRETQYPEFAPYQKSTDDYLRQIERLKTIVSVPIIASLNGHSTGRWIDFAPHLENAGANAIELNFYQVVANPTVGADQVETEMIEAVSRISSTVRIPVSVKLSPYHSSVAQLALALELAGAAGVVVFNRFYQPDINVDDLEVQPVIRLSDPGELLLRLRWLAILSPILRCSLAVTGGVHTGSGVVKSLLAGAHCAQLVSVLLTHGAHAITTLRDGLELWMKEHGFSSLDEFCGMLNHRRCSDPAAYERANYIRTLQSWRS
jgi:dihydroorotate dehydrogenase (fumarate)